LLTGDRGAVADIKMKGLIHARDPGATIVCSVNQRESIDGGDDGQKTPVNLSPCMMVSGSKELQRHNKTYMTFFSRTGSISASLSTIASTLFSWTTASPAFPFSIASPFSLWKYSTLVGSTLVMVILRAVTILLVRRYLVRDHLIPRSMFTTGEERGSWARYVLPLPMGKRRSREQLGSGVKNGR
jgi:hypothetical protein